MLRIVTHYSYQKGFTLIEVMAAVAVFAISAAGLYSINQQTVLTTDRLERKAVAHWVAMNRYNTLSLETKFSYLITTEVTEKMMGIEWKVNAEVSDTPVQTVKRVVIAVSDNTGQRLAQINGFIGEKKPSSLTGFQQ